ncbi:unnamed protein product [Somion occarium]|uniref:F-box domain-containing protein n=1 Tax=Somion occarium TaxID=3059160 RepID=A0ABP1E0G9_9APHY
MTQAYDFNGKCVLNFDVLLVVMSFLWGPNLLSMMRTCKFLYRTGIPMLLEHGVYIWPEKHAVSFCRFLSTDTSYRFRFLRKLTIWHFPYDNPHLFRAILKTLQYATRLQELELNDAEEFLVYDEHFARVVSSLLDLRCLVLSGIEEQGLESLRTLRAPLTHLTVRFGAMNSNEDPPEPTPFLASVSNTLEMIDFDNPNMEGISGIVVCPKVHTFKIQQYWTLPTRHLVLCFPNLKRLNVLTEERLNRAETDAFRVQNKTELASTQSWTSLDRLDADVNTAFLLALNCRVSLWNAEHICHWDWRKLPIVLGDIHPTRLTLRVLEPEAAVPGALLDLSPATELTSLSLEVEIHRESADLSLLMTRVAACLETAQSLVTLRLSVVHHAPRPCKFRPVQEQEQVSDSDPGPGSDSDLDSDIFKLFARECMKPDDLDRDFEAIDMFAFATRLATSILSLKYVFVGLARCYEGPFQLWSVTRTGCGDAFLQTVDAETANDVLRHNDMPETGPCIL